jgi:hypothetical protein
MSDPKAPMTIVSLCVVAVTALAVEPVHIGTRRELFTDAFLIECMEGARLELHEPVPAETVLRLDPDRPWEGTANMGVAVWKDGDGFRMHYRCLNLANLKPGAWTPEWGVAESRDGIRWTRPDINARRIESGRPNNLIADEEGNPLVSLTSLFLNTRPGAPPEERYFGLRIVRPDNSMERSWAYLYMSADGFAWRQVGDEPVYRTDLYNAFDSQPMLFWSEAEGQYVMYHRYLVEGRQAGADSLPGIRSVARTTSPDLRTWSEPVRMSYDTPGNRDPYANFYTNGTQPYPRAPHQYLAFYARLIPERRVVTDAQVLRLGLPTMQSFRYDIDCSDSAFMTVRAEEPELFRQTFKETFIRPGSGPENWTSRSNYALAGMLQTGPDELSIYVNRQYLQPAWHIQRLTLRLDGFASAHAPYEGGELVTRPLIFDGRYLTLNHANGAPGDIRVEIQDAAGVPLPGFDLEACDPIYGDTIERGVTWRGGDGNVGALAGQPVRLRFAMRDADLYAFRFLHEPPMRVAYVREPTVRIADAPALDAPGGSMTVELFLFVDSPNGAYEAARVASKYNHRVGNTGRGWEIHVLPTGHVAFRVNQAAGDTTATGRDWTVGSDQPIPPRKWVHAAAVFDRPSRRMRIYVDGRLAGEQSIADEPLRRTPGQDLVIGRYGTPGGIAAEFRGRIDELRITAAALDFDRPPAAPYTGKEPGTVALYHFDARDSDGTVPNAAGSDAGIGGVLGVSRDGAQRLVDSMPGFGQALGLRAL